MKPAPGDAFEEVLYGSESEVEDASDNEGASSKVNQKQRNARGAKNLQSETRLRVDDDEPMDLLHGSAARLAGE